MPTSGYSPRFRSRTTKRAAALTSAGLLVEHSTYDAFAADGTGEMVRIGLAAGLLFSKQLARAIGYSGPKGSRERRFGHWLANG